MKRASSMLPRRKVATPSDHPPRLSLRVDLGNGNAIGPGKIQLLELIAEHGSIAAAGRVIGMSYRRAWLLVEDLKSIFAAPLVSAQQGGNSGGGAQLTELGCRVVEHYRRMEANAARAVVGELRVFDAAIKARRRRARKVD
jgi:molybdate transport system regulatory protein